MTEEPDVVLVDEDGVEHRFFLYEIIEVDEKSYTLLRPEDAAEGEVVVLRIEGPLESGTLVTISDEEWERVVEALEELDEIEE